MKPEFLISSCLCGENVRYGGGGFHYPALRRLAEEGRACGSCRVYDGAFSGVKIPGEGVTARLLRENGVEAYSEEHNIRGLQK